ncbi:MAG TPA: hypothetical protein VN612_13590 [Acidobacteriaceae bacterium]|nr:hypothetical protein [Acidobacteriaceae bacterium]
MSEQNPSTATHPDGPVAAALLACGVGCLVLGTLSLASDGSKRIASLLNIYNPTGPLSGVTTIAIAAWLLAWAVLARQWRAKQVAFGKVSFVAFVLLALGLLLTFPPLDDFLLGH